MRTKKEIARSLQDFVFTKEAEADLQVLAEEISTHPKKNELIEDVLKLFERFPYEDFGAPGPLAHAVEEHYKKGYVDRLAESLERQPTSLTIWLANRIVNAGDKNHMRFLKLLVQVSQRRDVDRQVAKQAKEFASIR
ncbi:MAG: hypothetical protein K8U03_01090 [Planctomycetia bacterium]|nr:hypothetical protein [Planctomycetia bacterium]